MKPRIVIFWVVGFLFSSAGYTENPPATQGANHPCQVLEAACKAAGFYVGGHPQGKGIFKDCMKPMLASGQPLSKVSVTPSEIQACQQKRATAKH